MVEVGELWGLSPGRVRSELQRARVLSETFPEVWALCLDGALDPYRAGLVADAATGSLHEVAWPELATASAPGSGPGDVHREATPTCPTWSSARSSSCATSSPTRPPACARATPTSASAGRTTTAGPPRTRSRFDGSAGDGTGALVLTSSVDRIQLADHRLTLAAKAVRASGDGRTLEQLRTDLALGLILGTTRIAPDGDATSQSPATGSWRSRPPRSPGRSST